MLTINDDDPQPGGVQSPWRRHFSAHVTILGVGLIVFLIAIIVPALRQHPYAPPVTTLSQSPLPVGAHEGLSSYETPTEDIGPKSRFVFEAEIPTGSGPSGSYWYAYPVASTVYLVNGATVDVTVFEQRLAKMPPARIDVVVQAPGELARINVVLPDSPQSP
jgi:hypothetical protein